ncbi:hypothetical protein HGRIS_011026 [Hohenbuehelia grisea]|uniref:Ricin B lectin domain-containing protein n=1 Tax=Hohenbuehelia grisea TaxID=104357 RepID=A0ABR3IYR0_9AGAR
MNRQRGIQDIKAAPIFRSNDSPSSFTPHMSINSGSVYRLINAKAGTALDLSGGDNSSIIGYPYHEGANQKWLLEWTGKGWTFKSSSNGLYLTLSGTATDGTRLTVGSTPMEWHVWPDNLDSSVYRHVSPVSRSDLWAQGDPTPGTPITLWYRWNGRHQTWKFEAGE